MLGFFGEKEYAFKAEIILPIKYHRQITSQINLDLCRLYLHKFFQISYQ